MIDDSKSPLNFYLWKKQNPNVSDGNVRSKYELYLKDWYSDKNIEKRSGASNRIREEYKNFIRALQSSFDTEEEKNFIESIDFDDEMDLSVAIPFYARKLKEISHVIARKRDEAKFTKLKYNLKGTSQGLQKVLYNYILNEFTQKPNELVYDVDFYDSLPQLSAINNNFSIVVDELYDETNYLDLENSIIDLTEYRGNIYDSSIYSDVYLTNLLKFAEIGNYSEYFGSEIDIVNAVLLSGTSELSYSLSSDVFSSQEKFLNILNVFAPSIALIIKSTLLKRKDQIGGYFVPKHLGISRFVNYDYQIEYSNTFTQQNQNISVPDRGVYNKHFLRLDGGEIISPIIHVNSIEWLKQIHFGNSEAFGTMRNFQNIAQRFGSPYQTKEEKLKKSLHGVSRFDDNTDFWYKDGDSVWSNQSIFPLSDRFEFDNEDRQRKLILTDKNLYSWSSTLDGIEVALYKSFTDSDTIFDKKYNINGEVWMRDPYGVVDTMYISLEDVLTKFEDVYSLSANTVRGIDIIEDVIIIDVEDYIIIDKIGFDFDSGKIVSKSENKYYLDYTDSNKTYGEFWYDEKNKHIVFCGIEDSYDNSLSGSNFQPIIDRYLIDENILEHDVNDYTYSDFTLPGLVSTTFDPPLITYNIDTSEYHVGIMVKENQNIHIVKFNFQIT